MREQAADFGVTITGGAAPWQIFQQDGSGTAAIRLTGRYRRVRLSQELPRTFADVQKGRVTVKARIARESSGDSVIPWTDCRVLDGGAKFELLDQFKRSTSEL